jgi:WD40 repeat protein
MFFFGQQICAQKPIFQFWLEAHQNYVEAVHFLDEQTLLSLSAENNFKPDELENKLIYWDLSAKKPRKQLSWGKKGEYIHHLSFSHDGRNFLVGSQRAYVYKIEDLSLVFESPESEAIYLSLALSRDERWLATANNMGLVEVWDLMKGDLKPQTVLQADCPVNSVAFSEDGQLLFCGLENGVFKFFEMNNLSEGGSFEEHEKDIFSISYSASARRVVTAGWDSFIHFWDIDREQLDYSIRGHEGYVEVLEFSPGGEWLASGGGDGTVRIWDAKEAELLGIGQKHNKAVLCLSFSPKGKYLAVGGADKKISIWSFKP